MSPARSGRSHACGGDFWDTLLRTACGPFVLVREGLLPFPLAPEAYWLFDPVTNRPGPS
ncbi:hypothetical protein ACQP1P_26700 [Dactylosporangium sp. CA-052675]|uniref:hypothetical protein n=1 Tax=Dactylosporangium sp. CA-052675 TaxID=3239927 RepID=UPI003D8AE6E6